ncbi:acylneuraminate cytidylyltransferase family protein [Facilibium subflavum]|uniref:acylneuraminate cytidylyltransferase family protein n=1 Tax=Facilibium subflavum TaxID=2219058 RepID=UPI000E6591E8|nr:acylneuraminate cytidylyltransferase family protein [Facilibium subflavum]
MNRITALLPMKGNSERVPNKNLKFFDGAPLYHAILNKLLKSKYIERVVIDTDSPAIIADIKSNYSEQQVEIIERPLELVGDYVSMNKIIAYDLSILKGEYFIQTHSTNPLIKIQTIDSAIHYFFENLNTSDSIFSVTKLQTRLYDKHAKPINHNPEELRRTQDLEPLYEENSNFYIFSRDSFLKAGSKRIGLKANMFEVGKLEAIDIDEPEDFLLAEFMYINLKEK